MSGWTWLLVLLNFLICCWDCFAGGVLWGLSDRINRFFGKFIGACALTIGFFGNLYVFVLIGILTGYLPEQYLLASNVVLGAPIILAGLVITVNGWYEAIRQRSIFGVFVGLWNTFAIIWDIRVWLKSFKAISDMGGFKSILKVDSKDKAKVAIFLIIVLIMASLISIGLFLVGKRVGSRA